MKRIISLLLVLMMLMSVIVYFPTVSTAAASAGRGDVNADGVISIKDSLMLRKYMSALYDPSGEELDNFKTAADVDKSGRVNAKDSRYLKMYLVCEITSFDNLSALPNHPTVTIAGNDIQNYVIIFPDEWVQSGWSVNAEDGYYGGGLNPVHYSARSMRVYAGGFCHASFGGTNIKTVSQAVNDKYRIELVVDETGQYGEEGFNIKVENGNVYITASPSRGMIYGTTEFMEKYLQGKFFANGNTNFADAEKAFDIPNGIDDTQEPGFDYRCMVGYTTSVTAGGGSFGHAYNCRRRINGYGTTDRSGTNLATYGYAIGRIGRYNAHSIYPYCNNWVEDYTKYTPCLSATENYNKVIAAIDADIVAHQGDFDKRYVLNKQLLQISCSMQDHNNVCACSTCMSKYQTYGCFNAVYFEFLNKVADHYYPIYGDELKIFSILYDRTYPEAFFANAANLPRSNMVLCYCQSGCGNHTLDGEGCQGKSPSPVINVWGTNIGSQYYCYGDGNNVNEMTRIRKFASLSSTLEAQNGEAFDLYVWYYPTNVHFYVCPSPNYFNILKDMRLLADAGVDGIYFESDTAGYAFEAMRDFLAAEAMWNPYMTQEEYELLMDQWLAQYCGDGWRYIKKYILMNEASTDGVNCWVNNYDYPWTMVSKSYYAQHYAEMKDLFTSAYSFATDDDQRDFILRARVHCDFLGLSALWSQRNSISWYYTEYDRMYNYLQNNVTYYADGNDPVSHGYFALGADGRKVGAYNVNPMVWLGFDESY